MQSGAFLFYFRLLCGGVNDWDREGLIIGWGSAPREPLFLTPAIIFLLLLKLTPGRLCRCLAGRGVFSAACTSSTGPSAPSQQQHLCNVLDWDVTPQLYQWSVLNWAAAAAAACIITRTGQTDHCSSVTSQWVLRLNSTAYNWTFYLVHRPSCIAVSFVLVGYFCCSLVFTTGCCLILGQLSVLLQ